MRRLWIVQCFIVIYTLVFALTYWSSTTDLPRGYHQWAQSDRLAIALRYAEGKPLTTPATYSLKSPDGDVGVEFSGFQYLISLPFQGYFSTHYLPAFYKIFTFTFLFFTLFMVSFRMLAKENFLFKCSSVVLLLSSPTLLHYGFGYLPDVWALSLVFLCLWLFHLDLSKYIYFILIISGLALLTKTSSGIYFCAFFGVYFLQNIRKPNLQLASATLLFLGIAAGVAWYDYYQVIEMNKKLWSYVFMSKTNPITSWSEFTEAVDTSWRFKEHYFSAPQRWGMLLLTGLSLWKIKSWKISHPVTQFCILITLGIVAIFLFFGVQFMDHDYYILSTLVPALMYFALFQMARIVPYVHPRTSGILVLFAAIVAFSQSNKLYFQRNSEIVHIDGWAERYPYKWLTDLDHTLDSLGTDTSKLFVAYVPEPNHSLLYARRKGAVFSSTDMNSSESLIYTYLPRIRPDFMMMPSDSVQTFTATHPDLVARTQLRYKNQYFVVYSIHGY